MPPPSAVTMPSASIPMMSSWAALTPVIAPLSANANVPARSSDSSSVPPVMGSSLPSGAARRYGVAGSYSGLGRKPGHRSDGQSLGTGAQGGLQRGQELGGID